MFDSLRRLADDYRVTCNKCGIFKDVEAFSFRRASIRHTTCKDCVNVYNRMHYRKNSSMYKAKAKRWTRTNLERNRKLLSDYLNARACVDCGENDMEVLEFDHRDATKKSFNITDGFEGRSWNSIETEIAKCDIRCANCHRRRTNRQFGYWRTGLASTTGRAPVS